MNLTFIDGALWSLSVIGQILLFFVLVRGRLYRAFPVFAAYLLYSTLGDATVFAYSINHRSENSYFVAYFANDAAEFLLQLGILVEVGWNVLSPVKRSLPKSSPVILVALGVTATLAVFFLSSSSKQETITRLGNLFIQINYTFAFVRLVIFSGIVLFAQMLGIGWKNHVTQISTGFAGYSIVILLVELAHKFLRSPAAQYHQIEQLRIIGWLVALTYWIFVFTKKEADRKEFSPKMASFLVLVADTVRESRDSAKRLTRK